MKTNFAPKAICIIVFDGEIETSYHQTLAAAEAEAYEKLNEEWPQDEGDMPDDFQEAYNLSRDWSDYDILVEEIIERNWEQLALLAPDAAEIFKPVIEWLDAGAPHKDLSEEVKDLGFNMEHSIYSGSSLDRPFDQANNVCGTACCIAGAAVLFNPKVFSDAEQGVLSYVAERIHLTAENKHALFNTFGEGFDIPFENITPAIASATIKRFLETGIVTWDLNQ